MKTLIIGSGIAGITASLDIAEAGGDVILVEKEHFATGTLKGLDRQFPNDACGFCQVYPFTGDNVSQYCIRRVFSHRRIKVLTGTVVERIEGDGPFRVYIKTISRGVIVDRCISCRKCEEVCPVETEDTFNKPLGKRKAIYTEYPMPYPNTYAIDWDVCNRCGECVKVCPTNAIELERKETEEVFEVDNVIITTGFKEIDPSVLKEYGYGRYKNVVTGLEFERILSFFGPTLGELKRPSDGKKPRRIAFLQCVGSRDIRNPHCSYTCCMYAIKEMHLLKRFHPDVEAVMFYMDIRSFGKGYYRYFLDTDGVFIPQRIASIEEDGEGNLILKYEDENGNMKEDRFDMVVLAVGQRPVEDNLIERDKYGYPITDPFVNVKSKRDGILLAGSASGPKDIMDAVIEGHSAALEPVKKTGNLNVGVRNREAGEEPSVGIVLCDCGGTMKLDGIEEAFQDIPVLRVSDLCINKEPVLQWYRENGLNRVVFAACAPSFLDNVFVDTGINYEIADIREGVLWGGGNAEGIKFRVESAIKMLENRTYLPPDTFDVSRKVLVVGAGITGLNASLEIADAGFEVVLVEKKDEPGGNALKIKKLLTGEDVRGYLDSLIQRVKNHERIHLRTGENVQEVKGSLGNFSVKISGVEEVFGAIVFTTGAREYIPKEGEFGYNRHPNVITQMGFEDVIEKENLSGKTIVMIQCVGSRNDEHPWCSRVCCTDAIKNALRVKEKYPDAEVFILYRDIMSYGRKELYYTASREKGVIYLRFKKGNEPIVLTEDGLKVKVFDTVLRDEVVIDADYVVLSTGIVPDRTLYESLGIELTEDGFVKEANVKFKPLETSRPGIYVAGLAHSPRDIPESIAQARGVAAQVIGVLRKEKLVSKERVSYTKERKCAGCGFCVDACPYDARFIDEERKVAVVRAHVCQGCGTCVSVCPSGAADMGEMGYKEMFSVMEII